MRMMAKCWRSTARYSLMLEPKASQVIAQNLSPRALLRRAMRKYRWYSTLPAFARKRMLVTAAKEARG